jgi:hypothetical protein
MNSKTRFFRFIVAACATIFASAAAHAVTTTFDFTGNGGAAGSYNFTSGGVGVTVTATAYNTSTHTWDANALVGQYSGGLGVTNSQKISGNWVDVNSPQHSLDDNGWEDLLVFKFTLPVDVDSLSIGWYSGDDDFRYTIGGSLAAVKVMSGTGVSGTGIATYAINGANAYGSYFSVAAGQSSSESNDYFKVSKLKVTYQVPDTSSTLALTSLALVGVSAFRRRRAA